MRKLTLSGEYCFDNEKWINWIDGICEILQNKNSSRELCHEFVFSPHRPIGARMENFFASKESVTIDDARMLASFALADISDYITECFDKNFSFIITTQHGWSGKISAELSTKV